jgi:hypothetical protein
MRTLKVLTLLLTLIALPALAQVTADPARIQARIDKLATFGGTPEGGTSRPGFSEADKAAREWLIRELAGLGLSIRVDAADELGHSSLAMPSGAGHDAQSMAMRSPTGMIFVPSRSGVSHSPREFT